MLVKLLIDIRFSFKKENEEKKMKKKREQKVEIKYEIRRKYILISINYIKQSIQKIQGVSRLTLRIKENKNYYIIFFCCEA